MQRLVGVLLRVHTQTSRSTSSTSRSTSSRCSTDGRVVVGQVEQDQPVELVLGAARPRSPPPRAPSRAARTSAAAGRRATGPARSRPPRPRRRRDARDVVGRRTPTGDSCSPGERVEQRRLAAAGGAGQRDDGVLARQPEPFPRPSARRPRPADGLGGRRGRPARRSPRRGRSASPGRSARRCRPRSRGLTAASAGIGPPSGVLVSDGVAQRCPAAASTRRRRLGEALSLGTEQLVDPGVEVGARLSASLRTAWSPRTASSSFWLSAEAPPATAISPATSPPVCANTTIISISPRPLTPKAR